MQLVTLGIDGPSLRLELVTVVASWSNLAQCRQWAQPACMHACTTNVNALHAAGFHLCACILKESYLSIGADIFIIDHP